MPMHEDAMSLLAECYLALRGWVEHYDNNQDAAKHGVEDHLRAAWQAIRNADDELGSPAFQPRSEQ